MGGIVSDASHFILLRPGRALLAMLVQLTAVGVPHAHVFYRPAECHCELDTQSRFCSLRLRLGGRNDK